MKQKEYIDRVAFRRKLIDEKAVYPACVARALDEMPAEDVVEVVHGRWLYDSMNGVYNCSRCGNAETSDGRHCSYCGAKMDGGNN